MLTPAELERYGIVDPTAPDIVSTDVRRASAAASLDQLDGVAIEYLFNGKQGGDILFAALDEWLIAECRTVSLGMASKLVASTPAAPELLSDMAARARLVVTGPGD